MRTYFFGGTREELRKARKDALRSLHSGESFGFAFSGSYPAKRPYHPSQEGTGKFTAVHPIEDMGNDPTFQDWSRYQCGTPCRWAFAVEIERLR